MRRVRRIIAGFGLVGLTAVAAFEIAGDGFRLDQPQPLRPAIEWSINVARVAPGADRIEGRGALVAVIPAQRRIVLVDAG